MAKRTISNPDRVESDALSGARTVNRAVTEAKQWHGGHCYRQDGVTRFHAHGRTCLGH
jgi:hypothetical protein